MYISIFVLVSQTLMVFDYDGLFDDYSLYISIYLLCFVNSSLVFSLDLYCNFHTCMYGLFSVFQEFTG